MKRNELLLCILLCILSSGPSCRAENWLRCHIVDVSGAPVRGITVEVVASKPVSIPTDRSGYTKVLVRDSITVGQELEIDFVDPKDAYALLIPEDRRIKMPPANGFATIVLAKPGDTRILQHGRVMVQIAATVLARGDRLTRGPERLPEETARREALAQISDDLGFTTAALADALHAWARRAQAQYELAVAALYEGKYPRAQESLKAVFKRRQPTFLSFRESMFQNAQLWGIAAMKNRDYKEAATAFANALEIEPGAMHERELLGDCYYNLKKYAEAEEQYSQLAKQDEDKEYAAEGYEGLASVFEAQGKMEKAANALFDAAEAIYDEERPEDSVGSYDKAAKFLEKHRVDDDLLDIIYEKIIEVQAFANERPKYDEETAEKLVNLRISKREFGSAAMVYEDAIEWEVFDDSDPKIRGKIDELNAKQKVEDQRRKTPR